MNQRLIQNIVREVRTSSSGNYLGKIFQLHAQSFALDIGIRGSFLFFSVDPGSPRFYLIKRKVKELERQALQLSHFGQLMKSHLGGGRIIGCEKDGRERIVRLTFRLEDELGNLSFRRLVVQLTGRAANLFILDELNRVAAALRPPKGRGQNLAERYLPPPLNESGAQEQSISINDSPSAAADTYFLTQDANKSFDSKVGIARNRIRQLKTQKTKLRRNLQRDLVDHGDPGVHKKLGDLLLANLATAERQGNKTTVIDYYSDGSPMIDVEIDEATSLQDAASQKFRQYTKAKRAQEEIAKRLSLLEVEISDLDERDQQLDRIARERDETGLVEFSGSPATVQQRERSKNEQQMPGVRRYLSTDGYEILVGRGAKDNDNLTFRIARPNDLWLHAGDYPGSHVVVRNPNRKEIPQRTVIEAAQLAGKFSQANADAKVVIHYTERKFLSKPKGSAPGLVRLSSFRSITVEPKEGVKRL